VRMALGASSANVMTMVVRQGMTLVVLGLAAGAAGAAGAVQALRDDVQRFARGVDQADDLTVLAVRWQLGAQAGEAR